MAWAKKRKGIQKRPIKCRVERIALEELEDRTVPAIVSWDGGAGTSLWNDAANWSGNVLPTAADDVLISGPATVTLASGTTTIKSLVSSAKVNVQNSNVVLTATDGIQVNNEFFVGNGATLKNTQVFQGTGVGVTNVLRLYQATLDNVILDTDALTTTSSNATVNVLNGLEVNRDFRLGDVATFVGTQTLSGTGSILFSKDGATIKAKGNNTLAGAATLTIGPDLLIDSESGSGSLTVQYTSYDRIESYASIRSSVAGETVTLSYVDLHGDTTIAGGTLEFGTSTTNDATVNLNDGLLKLSGAGVSQAQLGNFTRSGGEVDITSTTFSGDLILNATTGDWNFASLARWTNGTYSATDGAFLTIRSGDYTNVTFNSSVNVSAGGTLQFHSVINNGYFKVNNSTAISIQLDTGWINNGTIEIANGTLKISNTSTETWTNAGTFLVTSGTLELGGTFTRADIGTLINTGGEIDISGILSGDIALDANTGSWNLISSGQLIGGTYTATGGSKLIINSGSLSSMTLNGPVTATGAFSVLGSGLVNNGLLRLTGGSTATNFKNTWWNNGTIEIDGGSLSLIAGAAGGINSGLIHVLSGVLTVSGNYTQDDFGTIVRSGGEVNIAGTLTGGLALDTGTGSWSIDHGGTILGGVITASGGSHLFGSGGTIESATIAGPVVVTGSLTLTDTINDATLEVDGGSLYITFGPGGFTNAGTVILNDGNVFLLGALTQASLGNFMTNGGRVSIQGTFSGDLDLNGSASDWYFDNASSVFQNGTYTNSGSATLTFKSGSMHDVVLNGASAIVSGFGSIDNLTNNGYLQFTVNQFIGRWNNQGIIDVLSGTTSLNVDSSKWTNDGVLRVSGGTLNLTGLFTQTILGDVEQTGGIVNIAGTMTGGLFLGANAGRWNLASSGTLWNGTYSSAGDSALVITGGTLNGMTIDSPVVSQVSTYFTVVNGLVLNSVLAVSSGGARFSGTQSLTGTGEWIGLGSGAYLSAYGTGTLVGAATLTIGEDIRIRDANLTRQSTTYDGIILYGTIIADGSNIAIDGTQNRGTVHARGSNISLGSNYTQSDGQTIVDAGRTFGTSGKSIAINGGELRSAGTVIGNVANAADVSIGQTGSSIATTFTIQGTYTQATSGRLLVDVPNDRLAVTGAANLNGTVAVSLASGFNPSSTPTATILSASSITGAFASVADVASSDSITFSVSKVGATIVVSPSNSTNVWVFAGGSYEISEGDGLTLQSSVGSGAVDPGAEFSWDINGDGTFGDAFGQSPALSWSQLVTLGINDGYSIWMIGLRYTSPLLGQTLESQATLTVKDTLPTATVFAPDIIFTNQPWHYAVRVSDPSPVDQAAGFAINVNGQVTYGTLARGERDSDQTINSKAIVDVSDHDGNSVRITRSPVITSGANYEGRDATNIVRINSPVDIGPGSISDPSYYVFNSSQLPGIYQSLNWETLQNAGLDDAPRTITGTIYYTSLDGTSFQYRRYSQSVRVDLLNAPPEVTYSAPSVVNVGQTVYFDLSLVDPSSADMAAGFTINIDWNGDGVVDESILHGQSQTISHTFTATGDQLVVISATDKNGGKEFDAHIIKVVDQSAGGSYSLVEGDPLSLMGSSSDTDPSLTYSWDLNGDDDFSDATGLSPTLSPLQLLDLGITAPGSYSVRLRVFDGSTYAISAPTTLTVLVNDPPVVSITAPSQLVRGQSAPFVFGVSDSTPGDDAGPFIYQIDWDGDGMVDESIIAGALLTVDHEFPDRGLVDVHVSAIDPRGLEGSVASHSIDVRDYLVVPNGANAALFDLIFGGTSGDDQMSLSQIDPETILLVYSDAPDPGGYLLNVTGQVIAYGYAGDDTLDADVNGDTPLTIPVVFYGGAGNDWLFGGIGNDSLFGGEDQDVIVGNFGNDYIDGGSGADAIVGDVFDPLQGAVYGTDTIYGGDGNDIIYGDSDGGEGAADLIDGGSGDDTIFGDGAEGSQTGSDTIYGGDGNDTISGDQDGAEGAADVISGEGGDDNISGGAGNDTIDGGSGDDILVGGDGAEGSADSISGGDGRDILIGDDGADVLKSTAGDADTLSGGAGEDLIIAGAVLPTSLNPVDVLAIRAEWISSRSLAERMANITGTGTGERANANSFLLPGVNVFNDKSAASSSPLVDEVLGGSEADWIFVDTLEDDCADLEPVDLLVDLSSYPKT